MAIVLYHHPFSRAGTVLWMLEELGVDYELRFVDFTAGGQKTPEILKLNPMGKLPILLDGEQVATEVAAIGLYLADRYGLETLAPKPDDPRRGTYLRWTLFAPSVIEPGAIAKANGWQGKPSQVGWGKHEDVLSAIEAAIANGDYLLGDQFTMADVIFGGTLRYMVMVKMLEATPAIGAYVARLAARPAAIRAEARNKAVAQERGLGR